MIFPQFVVLFLFLVVVRLWQFDRATTRELRTFILISLRIQPRLMFTTSKQILLVVLLCKVERKIG
jgi:hypothetical protein